MADAILISIQPEYAEKILSGEKTFEFRRRTAQRPVGLMVIYASASMTSSGPPSSCWGQAPRQERSTSAEEHKEKTWQQ